MFLSTDCTVVSCLLKRDKTSKRHTLRIVYTGEFVRDCRLRSLRPLLALATLGYAAQVEMNLLVLRRSRYPELHRNR
jgi:hypothetical protein